MRVLQVAAYYAAFSGNFINSLLEIDHNISEKGGEVVYAFPQEAKNQIWCRELQKKRKIYFLRLKRARISPKTYITIRKICIDERIDIVHSHFELYDIPVLFSPKNTIIIWHMHDVLESKFGLRSAIRILQYKLIPKRAHIIAISEYDRQSLLELGVASDKIDVIMNGISTNTLNDIQIPKKNPVFLTLGWDFIRKGVDLILEASKRLKQEGMEIELIINCREDTISSIQEHINLQENNWIKIQYPQCDITEVYKNANIFIQASRHETFSFAVCEAVYAGLSVIISDIQGLSWAKELDCVSVFQNENIEQLYRKMKDMVVNFNNLEWDRARDRAIIEEKYSTKRWAKDIQELYEKLQ